MEFIQKGNQLFVEEKYFEASNQYTKALPKLMGKTQFPALFGRGRALIYLDKHSNAISDFSECLSLNYQHQLANYYLGLCFMKIGKQNVEKAKLAHKYLLIAQNGSSKQQRFEKSVNKSIKLLQKLQPKSEISSEINNGNNENNNSNHNDNNNDQVIEMKEKEKKKVIPVPKQPIIRDSWYQSPSNITFILYAKNLTKNDVKIQYLSNKVITILQLQNGATFQRNLLLKGDIIPSKCSFTMNKYKIIINLIKAKIGDWDNLEATVDGGKHSTISTPWNTTKNWDEVDKLAKKELESEKPEGDEALQQLFSKIYGDADEDQKRAMVKSFQTSGGTVLSTNWNDVKNKDYEGKDKVLPTGQNVKQYEY